MPKPVAEVVIFVASPGDLTEERQALKGVQDEVNASFERADLRVRVVGWETVKPDVGRPQAQINPMIERCEIFIGMVRRDWGTPTGEYDSGFEEEFALALEHRRASKQNRPIIAIFFGDVPDHERRDPGKGLTRVLAFKREVEQDHTLLYRTFSHADDLVRQVSSLLTEHLIACLLDSEPLDSPAGSGGSATSSAVPASDVEEGAGGAGEAPNQVADALGDLLLLVRGLEPQEDIDRDRIALIAAALDVDDEELGVHHVNRLYQRRDDLQLVVAERDRWRLTLLADIGRNATLQGRVVPGWGALGAIDEVMVAQLVRDASSSVHSVPVGATRTLARLRLRPIELWPAGLARAEVEASRADGDREDAEERIVDTWVAILNADKGQGDAIDYLLDGVDQDPGAEPEKFGLLVGILSCIRDDAGLNESSRDVVANVLAALDGDLGPLVKSVGRNLRDNSQTGLILRHLALVDHEGLSRLAEQKDNQTVRLAAVARGLENDSFTDTTLTTLLTAGDEGINGLIVDSAGASSDLAQRLLEHLREGTKKTGEHHHLEARLVALALDPPEILAAAKKDKFGSVYWEALTHLEPGKYADEARETLATRAHAFRQSLEPLLSDPKVVDYLVSERCRASLNLLFRLEERQEGDLELVLDYLVSEKPRYSFIRSETWAGLARMADAETIPRIAFAMRGLVEVTGLRYLIEGMETPLAPVVAEAFLDSDDEFLGDLARPWWLRQPERTNEELLEALYEKDAKTRVSAFQALMPRLADDEKREVLNQYTSGDREYWYNIVAGLDEQLYAPTPRS